MATTPLYDVVVVGLGAMGAATLWRLAESGARVLGIDRFAPPHARGSTHGDTRITRLALGEGAAYVPLARRSHELWRELEERTGEDLLTITGGAVIADAGAGGGQHGAEDFLGTTAATARDAGIAHEVLDAAALAERLPAFRFRGDERGVFEPSAGFVRPERAVAAELAEAERAGAEVLLGERVTRVGGGAVATETQTFHADTVVVCAGPWVGELVSGFAPRVRVTRQVLHWFDLAPGAYEAHRDLPVYIWLTGEGPEELFYGFPAIDGPAGGVKIAGEQFAATTTADAIDRAVPAEESAALHARHLARRLPGLTPRAVRAVTCPYTSTANGHFAIGRAPEDDTLLVVSACSGHGFKHSAAIGEAVAALALRNEPTTDLRPFAVQRVA